MHEIERNSPSRGLDEKDRVTGRELGHEVSILALVNILLRRYRIVLGLPVVAVLLAAVGLAIAEPKYSATSAILPETSGGTPSRLSGLAAQFGFDFGSSPSGESLAFYAALVRSREILSRVGSTEFSIPSSTGEGATASRTLGEHWKVEASTPEARLRQVVGRLRDRVKVSTDDETGLVWVRTYDTSAAMAEAVNARLLELLNEFNLERRRSRVAAERTFVGERLEEAEAEFRESEKALEAFLEQNRRYEASPELAFEAARLQRRVDFTQQVYTSLAQNFEQARIEEVRNTPVFTVIERPEGSVQSESPNPFIVLCGAAFFAFAIGVGTALAMDAVITQREHDPAAYEEYLRLRQGLGSEFGIKRLQRVSGSGASNTSDSRADDLGTTLQ